MDKSALEASLNSLDIWLIVFGILVAIGAVGGSVAGFLHWRRSGELQIIQTSENLALQRDIGILANEAATAKAHIAAAQQDAARASERAAAANERAGKLEVEAGRLRLALDATAAETARLSRGFASRHIFESQRSLIASVVRGKSFRVDVQSWSAGNPEVDGYANELGSAFQEAGLTVSYGSNLAIPPPIGIAVIDSVDRAHSDISAALEAAQIEFEFRQASTQNPIVRVGVAKSPF